jgi:hypothetical protein
MKSRGNQNSILWELQSCPGLTLTHEGASESKSKDSVLEILKQFLEIETVRAELAQKTANTASLGAAASSGFLMNREDDTLIAQAFVAAVRGCEFNKNDIDSLSRDKVAMMQDLLQHVRAMSSNNRIHAVHAHPLSKLRSINAAHRALEEGVRPVILCALPCS